MRCVARAGIYSPGSSPLTSRKNVGHSGHLSQAMTHNVQLPRRRARAARLSHTRRPQQRENADRVEDVGRVVAYMDGEQTPRPSSGNRTENLIPAPDLNSNELNGSFPGSRRCAKPSFSRPPPSVHLTLKCRTREEEDAVR